nr:receptor activity-modifying protein 2 isoform X3 [Anas platyrhynchos]
MLRARLLCCLLLPVLRQGHGDPLYGAPQDEADYPDLDEDGSPEVPGGPSRCQDPYQDWVALYCWAPFHATLMATPEGSRCRWEQIGRSTPNISATAAGRSPPGWGGRPPGWLPLWLWGWAASCPSQPPSPSAEPGEGLGARRGVAQPPVSQCLNWAESKPRGFNGGGEGRRGISQPSPDRIKEKYTSKQNRGLLTPDGAAKGAEASPRPGRPGCPTAPVRGKESLPVISIEILVPLVSPAGCGRMAPCAPTGSGRLSRGLLLLWALLGRGLCHTAGKADGFGQEARTSPPMAKENSTEEVYGAMAERCWEFFVELMRNVTVPQLCDWKVISRPYSLLQECLEGSAEHLNHGYPNALAERFIFQSHHRYFHNCSVGNQVFDPPEDVLLAMVFAPICLIPFLVTVVIWRSKDGKAQP